MRDHELHFNYFWTMNRQPHIIAILICIILLLSSGEVFAQKKNGKVTIEIEKGGVEKGKIKNGLREGTWKSYNSKGELIKEENFLNGMRHGDMKAWDDSTMITGHYTTGQKDGTFITKINGQVVSEIGYMMDTLNGQYFTTSKEKTVYGFYQRGRKSGLRVVDSLDYDRNRIKDSTYFKNGLRDGMSALYINGVLVTRTHWTAGKRDGIYREYDLKTGILVRQGNYLADLRDGVWRTYAEGKLRSVEDYEKGIHASNTIMYEGDTTVIAGVESYYPDGMKRMTQLNDEKGRAKQRTYCSPQGNVDSIVSYYPSGKIKDAHYTAYVNNEGVTQFYTYQSFYMNGKVKSRGYEHKDQRDGNWLIYDSTGRVFESEHYIEGKPFGWFKTYYSSGALKLQAYCYEGITDTILVYSKSGVKLSQKDPAYSKTIEEVQLAHPEIQFRDPNKFPPDHKLQGIVSLGPDANEGKWADEPATFPGGIDSLNAFIKKNVRFPEPERRTSKEGEVHIKFLIEKDGTLSDVQIVKEVPGAPGFTKETMRLMRAMPNWIPAKTNGKIVRVYYILPVKFSLE